MLTQQEQQDQQAVLQELLAGPDQALVDAAKACPRPVARAAAPPEPTLRSQVVVAVALSSHVMLALGLLTLPAGLILLMVSAFLAPPATICSLLATEIGCAHRNRRHVLIGILTLPLNVAMCFALYDLMANGYGGC
jgi:hypothetical protein